MNDIRKITNDEYLKLSIDDLNYNQMNNKQKEEYLNIYSLYMNYFLKFLIKKINLQEYDNLLKVNNPVFIPLKDNMDIYQLISKNLLEYFYIRNNIYLSRLNNVELEYLRNKILNNDLIFDENTFNFIDLTYKRLIFEVINDDPNIKGKINYGPNLESDLYYAPNNGLILGIRYDEFNLGGMNEEEWFLNRINQKEYIKKVIIQIENEVENKLNIPCKIIEYDQYSVELNKNTNKKMF